jgi:two-component system nitrate/nitrite response regulator NarP
MATSVRVIVAAAEPLLVAGCRSVLRTGQEIDVVADCSTMPALVRALRRYRPHVLVMDSALCERDQFEACANIPEASPETKIAWLARPGIEAPDQSAFRQIAAVLPPQLSCELLVECVRALAAGRRWRSPAQRIEDASGTAVDQLDQADQSRRSPLAALTLRERQIVLGVTSGKRNREIAESLGITPGTVKLHLHKAFAKLGVHSRLDLFRKMVQEAQPRSKVR